MKIDSEFMAIFRIESGFYEYEYSVFCVYFGVLWCIITFCLFVLNLYGLLLKWICYRYRLLILFVLLVWVICCWCIGYVLCFDIGMISKWYQKIKVLQLQQNDRQAHSIKRIYMNESSIVNDLSYTIII